MSSTPTYMQPEPQHHSGLLIALVAGALIALVAANIYLYVQVDHLRTDMAAVQEKMLNEVSNLRDTSAVSSSAQMRHIETLKEELAAARAQAASSANQAKVEANAHAEQIRKQLEAEQAQAQKQVASEISDVKQTANAANTKIANRIDEVSTDVGGVKTQVSATQAELQKTIADLKSTRGDLGVQSGLIATNASELQALRRLGERNYIDVKLGKEKKPTRVGDILIQLEKVDAKKNTYTVLIIADDKKVEKKDKGINEPVQFLVAKGGHTPYELVINSVVKKPEQIIGYLETPKVEATR